MRAFFERYPSMASIVRFTGHISSKPELYELYKRSRLYLVPSTTESFEITMLEAAFCGNVLVGYDVGGMSDITNGSEFGRVLQVGDERAFIEALRDCLRDRARLEMEGKLTRNFVLQNFVVGTNLPKILEKLNTGV